MTRYYDWTINKQSCAPDGVNTTCLLVNGEFPGPMIEANWGDKIEVKVTNGLSDEGAALHWHGILQKGSQPSDGVPGVSHCPIAPGKTLTYTFNAELYGTSWWHGHYSSQYASGLSGPMVIYGPNTTEYDIDLGPIQMSDWYHTYYKDLLDALSVPTSQSPVYPESNNILINGKNPFNCAMANGSECSQAPLATFNLTSGKTHRMRFINAGADATLKISLDDHRFEVIAQDFVPVQSYWTDVLTLGIGQRNDVIVHAKNTSHGAYWLRAMAPPGCGTVAAGGQSVGKAAIYYENANRTVLPISPPNDNFMEIIECANDALEKTLPVLALASGEPSESVDIEMQGHANGTYGKWWMNNVTGIVDYNDPVLLRSKMGNNSFPRERNVYQYDSSKKSIRFIVRNRSGNPHPMHLHGHNIQARFLFPFENVADEFQVLAEGTANATWDGTVVRPDNPSRRDVQMVTAWGYIVLQWNQDNPGAWPFHCHIVWHLSLGEPCDLVIMCLNRTDPALGMMIEVLESPDLIPSQVDVPSTIGETCREWWSYTNHNVVDQIDSGI